MMGDYVIEFSINGATWTRAASVADQDLADAALRAFRRASRGVRRRMRRESPVSD